MPDEVYRPLSVAAQYLNNLNPDWASQQNGVGFNQPDSGWGRRLAGLSFEKWTDEIVSIAYKMLWKYRNSQLRGIVDYDAMPKPAVAPNADLRLIAAQQERIASKPREVRYEGRASDGTTKLLLVWPYDKTQTPIDIQELKDLLNWKEREWDKERRRGWIVYLYSLHTIELVEKFARDKKLEWTDEALMAVIARRELFSNGQAEVILERPEPESPAQIVPVDDNTVALMWPKTHPRFNDILYEVRELPRRKWDPEQKRWLSYLDDPQNVDAIINIANKFKLTYVGDTRDRILGYKERLDSNAAASRAMDADIDLPPMKRAFFTFQKAGILYGIKNKRIILGDEMGTGKSIQTIGAIEYLDAYPALVICPASLKLNWKREFDLTVNRRVSVYDTKNGADWTAEVVVINYDNLGKEMHNIGKVAWKFLACDEAHMLKSGKALRSKAALEISEKIEYVFLLTGTPIMNRPEELVHPLTILRHIKAFGGKSKFLWRYCQAHTEYIGSKTIYKTDGAANLKELHDSLRGICLVRRLKTDVLSDLPDRTNSIVPMELSNKGEYERAEADVARFVAELALMDDEFLASIQDLPEQEQRKAKRDHYFDAHYRAKSAEVLVRINALRQLCAQGKMKQAIQWIETFLESGQKLVLFGWHREIVRQIAEHFKAPLISGDTPVAKRQEYVDQFQNEPDCNLIVLNIAAGGVGLTLTAASNVAFLELAWRPGDIAQASDRIHRIGQHYPCTSWFLLAEGTIDSEMWSLLEAKLKVFKAAMDGVEDEEVNEASTQSQVIAAMHKKYEKELV